MKMTVRRFPLALTAIVALMVGPAALAWACSPQAFIDASPDSGPADTQVRVTGNSFYSGPVQVRWNDSTGPLLATTNGPQFSILVSIPNGTEPGVYYIVAIHSGSGTSYKATTTFEVTPQETSGGNESSQSSGGSTSGSTSGGSGSSQGSGGSTSGSTSGGSNESSQSGGGSTSGSTSGGSGSQAGSGQTSAGVRGGDGSTQGSRQTSSGGDRELRSSAGGPGFLNQASDGAAVRIASGDLVFGGSLPPSFLQPAGKDGRGNAGSSGSGVPGAPTSGASDSSSFGDLWSGFSSDQSVLSSPATDPGSGSDESTRQLTLGLGLLGSGLTLLLAGFAVAEARRRRSRATTERR